jgi:hypothetical protein
LLAKIKLLEEVKNDKLSSKNNKAIKMQTDLLPHFKFIKENWADIAITWIDHSENLYLDVYDEDYIVKAQLTDIWWSCFQSAGLMRDIYDCYDRKGYVHPQLIKSYEDFLPQFKPGFLYFFGICDHNFVVVYDMDETLHYVDYYNETGRRDKFRVENIKKETFLSFVHNYINENFEECAHFHRGDKDYLSDYKKSYLYGKRINVGYLLEVEYFPINSHPTCEYIVNVVERSKPSIEMMGRDKGYENVEKFNYLYDHVIARLRSQIKNY